MDEKSLHDDIVKRISQGEKKIVIVTNDDNQAMIERVIRDLRSKNYRFDAVYLGCETILNVK